MGLVGLLPDVEVAGTEIERSSDDLLLVGRAGAGQVQVHRVAGLRRGVVDDEPEAQLRAGPGRVGRGSTRVQDDVGPVRR